MDKLLDLEIVTPQRPLFQGKITSVTVPGELAPFQILFNHAPIVSTLTPGVVAAKDENGNNLFFAVGTGFVMVQENKVWVCVDKAFSRNDVDKTQTEQLLAELKSKLLHSKSEKEKAEIATRIAELKAQIEICEK
jgi:F-type H+-transporting ATPase subunit epsilon